MKRKFNIGDIVRVRNDLEIGKIYYSYDGQSDIFTSKMRKNSGKEGKVIEVNHVGYRLDIDPIHTYTEEMLEHPNELAERDYKFDVDIEFVIDNSRLEFYRKKIDEALDNRMFETEPEKFQEIVDEYKRLFDKINLNFPNKSVDKR